MKLYRYRPLSELLFKELLYSEIYLASPIELNDPLDLNGQLNFFSKDEAKIKKLVDFISRQLFMVHISSRNYSLVKDTKDKTYLQQLASYITEDFSNRSSEIITKNDLFDILARFYKENPPTIKKWEQFEINELFHTLDVLFSKFLNNSTVVSFTENRTNFLMWSHYASGHTGICLEFEVTKNQKTDNSNIYNFPLISNRPIEGEFIEWETKIKQVKYSPSLTTLNFYDYLPVFYNEGDIDLMSLSKSYWHKYANGVENIFLEKLSPWSDENEWRIVDVRFQTTLPEERILKFNSNALTGIYFGSKTSSRTQARVRKAIEESMCNPEFYKCNVDGSRGINVEKI